MKSKVLVTGSSGFIGKNLINFLKEKNEFSLVTVSRDDPKLNDETKNHFQISSINSLTDWSEPLKGVDVVIHLAGIAHRSGTLEEYEEINVNGALRVAKQAIENDVHILGVSSLAAGHKILVPQVISELKNYKRKDIFSQTASNIQIRKPIYKHSLDKYLPYKQFLDKYGKKYSWFN